MLVSKQKQNSEMKKRLKGMGNPEFSQHYLSDIFIITKDKKEDTKDTKRSAVNV